MRKSTKISLALLLLVVLTGAMQTVLGQEVTAAIVGNGCRSQRCARNGLWR